MVTCQVRHSCLKRIRMIVGNTVVDTVYSDIFLMVTIYWEDGGSITISRIWNIKSTCWNNTCYLISSGFSEWKSQGCTLYTIQRKHKNLSPIICLFSSAKQEDIKLTDTHTHIDSSHTHTHSHIRTGESTNQDLGEARGLRVQLQREVSSSPFLTNFFLDKCTSLMLNSLESALELKKEKTKQNTLSWIVWKC